LKRKEILLESKSGLDGAGCVITTALQGEAKLHGFRSGGGLRVLRLGDFYGEAPTFEDALALLADDIRAGGRDYADVYGKLVPHYVTGNCAASSPVDLVLLRGCCVDAWREGVDVVATLGGYEELQVPADVCVRVDEGESVTWEARLNRDAAAQDRDDAARRSQAEYRRLLASLPSGPEADMIRRTWHADERDDAAGGIRQCKLLLADPAEFSRQWGFASTSTG
jgi:hypothetical protein